MLGAAIRDGGKLDSKAKDSFLPSRIDLPPGGRIYSQCFICWVKDWKLDRFFASTSEGTHVGQLVRIPVEVLPELVLCDGSLRFSEAGPGPGVKSISNS